MIQLAVGLLRDNRRDRCLAYAGRAVKDEVGNAAALDDAAQKSVFPEKMLLSHNIIQRFRTDFIG